MNRDGSAALVEGPAGARREGGRDVGGEGANLVVCGTQLRDSAANEFGAAVFLTATGSAAKLVIYDSLLERQREPGALLAVVPGHLHRRPARGGFGHLLSGARQPELL